MSARCVFWFIVGGNLLLGAAACRGGPLLGDDFEDRKPGQPPDPKKWQIIWRDTDEKSVSIEGVGSDATRSWCTFRGQHLGMRSQGIGARTEAWVEFSLRMERSSSSPQAAVVALVDDNGSFPCDLRLAGRTDGMFDAVVLCKDARGANLQQTVAQRLPCRQWIRWIFGVTLDLPGGNGHYWVYRDDRLAAENVLFRSFGEPPAVSHVQIWGDASEWSVDDVQVWAKNPREESELRRELAFVAPCTDWRRDYNCKLDSDGSIRLHVGAADYVVRSAFALPGGGRGWIGRPGDAAEDRTLPVEIARQEATGQRLAARTGAWKLERQVVLKEDHIAVSDALTNLSDEVLGVRFANEVDSPQADGFRVGGAVKPLPCVLSAPERPIVQLTAGATSVGLMVRDDVYRNQSILYAEAGRVGIRDDNFGLAPHASHTVTWEIYPLTSTSHFDLVNAIRHVWHADQATVPGLLAFSYFHRTWAGSGKTLEQMTVDQLRAWLGVTGIHTLGIVVNADPDAPGHEQAPPRFTKPWLQIEAFGSDVLKAEVSKAYWRPVVQRLRQAKPDLVIVPYFHMGANPIDPALADSRVLRQDGSQKVFRNFANITRGYYYATPDNSFGRLMRRVFQSLLDDPLYNGMYWDEFSFGNRIEHLFGAPDWENHSVIIDPKTNRVLSKVTNYALITQPMRQELQQLVARRGWPLWTNWQATTEYDIAQRTPHFLEYVRADEAARGQLGCPLGCGGHQARCQADVMKEVYDFLQLGLLYVHIHNGAYCETKESVLSHCYPITPLELGPGYVLGRERIITARSGTVGFGDHCPLQAVVYGRDGIRREAEVAEVQHAGRTWLRLRLGEGEIGIVTRKGP